MPLPRWSSRLALFALLLPLVAMLIGPIYRSQAETTEQFFPETGHMLRGSFYGYWHNHGGLAQQGYPITEEFTELNKLNGKPYTVQYFERAILELHPENKPPYDVLLSQLGTFRYKQKYPHGAPSQQRNPNSPLLFKETGHSIGGSFRPYWESHGGVAQLGLPLTDEFREASPLDKKTYTVQYFERAVLEWHPENAQPYNILGTQLGKFELDARYPNSSNLAAARVTGPPTSIPSATTAKLPVPAICNDAPGDTSLCISSEAGDQTGGGHNLVWTPNDALFAADGIGGLNAMIIGDTTWKFYFSMPAGKALNPGLYTVVSTYTTVPPDAGTITISHDSNGCATVTGHVEILEVALDPQSHDITKLTLIFEQQCAPNTATLRGVLRIHSNAGRKNPPPVISPTQTPVPPQQIAACKNAAGTSYFCYEYTGSIDPEEAGTHILTANDVQVVGKVDPLTQHAQIEVNGGIDSWRLEFGASYKQPLHIGRYDQAHREGQGSPVRPFLDISGFLSDCGGPGRFDIQDYEYDPAIGTITRFAANFEEQCGTGEKSVVGSVHINSNAGRTGSPPALPPTPVPSRPALSSACHAALAATSAQSYLCADGSAGAYIGFGRLALFDASDSHFRARFNGDGAVGINVSKSHSSWLLSFAPPQGTQLHVGVYDHAGGYPAQSPTKPGLDVEGEGQGCQGVDGRFEILEYTYDYATGDIKHFAANFEFRCQQNEPPLLGAVRFNSTVR